MALLDVDDELDDETTGLFLYLSCTLCLCAPLCCLVEAEGFLRSTGGVFKAEADWLELSLSLDKDESFL